MFSVYGKSGRIFRGTMEGLRQVGPLARSQRLHPVLAAAQDPARDDSANQVLVEARDAAHRTAVQAYAQMGRTPQSARHLLTRVHDIMTHPALTVSDQEPLATCLQLLGLHGVRQAPVVDAQGTLVGFIARVSWTAPAAPGSALDGQSMGWDQAAVGALVQDVMMTPVPSVAPDTDIRRLARVLLDTGLPGLPVCDEHGRVIGFASRTDILRAVVSDPPLDLWT